MIIFIGLITVYAFYIHAYKPLSKTQLSGIGFQLSEFSFLFSDTDFRFLDSELR